jgi:hypothetical protein
VPSVEPSLEPSPSPSPSPTPSDDPGPSSATIRTNSSDYAPGALVLVIGDGWRRGEEVALFVNDDEGQSWQHRGTATADRSGEFTYEIRLPSWFVATYTVAATGAESGQVRWRFTDSIGTGPVVTSDNGDPPASEITIATPSVPTGRLLLATIVVSGITSTNAICTPGGWTANTRTNRTSTVSVQTFYRVVTGSEALAYTWRLRSSSASCGSTTSGLLTGKGAVGGIVAYAGVNTASPIVSVTGATASAATVNAPAVASVAANAIVVRAFGNNRTSAITTAAASSTGIATSPVYTVVRAASGGGWLTPSSAVADADQPTTGSSGTLTASNGGAGGSWVAQTIILRMAQTQPMISITIEDDTAQLGGNLAPDGAPSDSGDTVAVNLDGSDPSAGACYEWSGAVSISSTLPYDVKVRAPGANPRLDFLVDDPADYAGCTGGQEVGPSMFPGADPAGAWLTGRSATTGRTHSYWLGLDVRWTDDPSATLGDTTLTFVAAVDW